MENLLASTRAFVLIGAVIFAFTIMIFGFVIVMREYRLLSSFNKLERFIKLTNNANIHADVTKGTLVLGRTRPGIILIVIGAIILIFCLYKPFVYESTQQSGIIPLSTPKPSVSPTTDKIEPSVTPASPKTDEKPPVSNPIPPQKEVIVIPATGSNPVNNNPQPRINGQSTEPKRGNQAAISPQLTVEAITALRFKLLDDWLSIADRLAGKSLEEQQNLLTSKFGTAYVALERVLQDKSTSFEDLAAIAYDSPKYAPLIRAFNPKLAEAGHLVPAYTNVNYFAPLALNYITSSSKKLQIQGGSRETVYQDILQDLQRFFEHPDFQKNPQEFWSKSGRNPYNVVDYYNKNTGRKFGLQAYQTQEGDTPELIARIKYGDARFVRLIQFFNPDKFELLQDSKKVLPTGTSISIFLISEF